MMKNTVEAFDNGLVDRATRREEAPQNTFVESFLKWVAFCIQSTAIRWDEAEDEENKQKTGHQCEFCTTLSTTERDSLTRPFVCVKWKVGGGRKGAKEAHAPILFRSNKKKFILNKHNQGLW